MAEQEQKQKQGTRSRFKRTFPDVFTDAPFRIEPRKPLPLVCAVRLNTPDPVRIESISLKLTRNNATILSATVQQRPVVVEAPFWHHVYIVSIPDDLKGYFAVEAFIRMEINGRLKTVRNCAEAGVKNLPLLVFRAEEPLPRFDGFRFGDLHFHGFAGKFGTPVPVSPDIVRAVGLDFYAAVMHSYGSRKNGADPGGEFPRFRRELEYYNEKHDVTALTGQEIACRNGRGRSVYMLAIGGADYVEGTQEAPDKLMPGRPKFALNDAVKRLGESAAVFAMHPVKVRPRWRDVLSRRGYWKEKDLETAGIAGMHICCLEGCTPENSGLREWTSLLLRGHRKYIAAGSHAKYKLSSRPVKPGVSRRGVGKDPGRVFGILRTGILCGDTRDAQAITACIRNGRSVVTNGPLLNFSVTGNDGARALLGGEIEGAVFSLKYRAKSSIEFGPILKIFLYAGDIDTRREECIFTFRFTDSVYSHNQQIDFEARSQFGYIRGELWTKAPESPKFCFTNPVWFRERRSE